MGRSVIAHAEGRIPAVAYEFKLPDLGEGLTEGEIARWLVAEGQEIAEDDPLVEIQTDKTTVEIPSPAAGRVASIRAQEGDVVPVGTVIVVIGDGGAGRGGRCREPKRPDRRSPPPSRDGRSGARSGDSARAPIAQELGVDLAGADRHRARTGASPRRTCAAPPAPAPASEGRREPLRGVRRLIAEHMTRAHREVPAVTWVEECDFGQRRPAEARRDRAQGVRRCRCASSPS